MSIELLICYVFFSRSALFCCNCILLWKSNHHLCRMVCERPLINWVFIIILEEPLPLKFQRFLSIPLSLRKWSNFYVHIFLGVFLNTWKANCSWLPSTLPLKPAIQLPKNLVLSYVCQVGGSTTNELARKKWKHNGPSKRCQRAFLDVQFFVPGVPMSWNSIPAWEERAFLLHLKMGKSAWNISKLNSIMASG